jgi:glutathione S-transferase
VCDDGEVLMDSTLILDYAQALAAGRSLMPSGIKERQHALRLVGLALAACEKSVQIVYERNTRPPEKQYEPWVERVQGQLVAACGELEAELQRTPLELTSARITQAAVTTAVAWQFMHMVLPGVVDAAAYPAVQALSLQAEQLPEFLAAPPR